MIALVDGAARHCCLASRYRADDIQVNIRLASGGSQLAALTRTGFAAWYGLTRGTHSSENFALKDDSAGLWKRHEKTCAGLIRAFGPYLAAVYLRNPLDDCQPQPTAGKIR
jgi:hypothetical protein